MKDNELLFDRKSHVLYGGERNSSVLAAGADCSSSGFQNLARR